MPSRRGGFEGGHTVALAPETARVRRRYRGRPYGKKLKTKNTKRDRGATSYALCYPAPDTLGETPPAQLRLHDPARRADPTRRVQQAAVRRAPKAGPADPAAPPLPQSSTRSPRSPCRRATSTSSSG